MGTTGGKIGFVAGIGATLMLAEQVIKWVPGPCFHEGGCGPSEPLLLVAAALITIAGGTLIGLIIRFGANWALRPD